MRHILLYEELHVRIVVNAGELFGVNDKIDVLDDQLVISCAAFLAGAVDLHKTLFKDGINFMWDWFLNVLGYLGDKRLP